MFLEEAGLVAQSYAGAPRRAANQQDDEASAPNGEEPDMAVLAIVQSQLDDDQAQDVVTIDLEGKSDVADAMIIASGRSQRHVASIADKMMRALKEAGYGQVSVEGMPACDWVLVDAGDVIVHLFRPEVRQFYNLERIWAPELFEEVAQSNPFAPKIDALEVAEGEE
ncbi:iojap-related protein [Parvularcula bermudensis HTCC2503]|uniref:Ribosomal silencing factor RsfS n=2 Tax=Parvularcula TaxID=208215 RepID=E0TFT9_PARBH|nr:iojap-related protein [Parvularcula bermudensis HTCC2503]